VARRQAVRLDANGHGREVHPPAAYAYPCLLASSIKFHEILAAVVGRLPAQTVIKPIVAGVRVGSAARAPLTAAGA
jgi:hypothetical protein